MLGVVRKVLLIQLHVAAAAPRAGDESVRDVLCLLVVTICCAVSTILEHTTTHVANVSGWRE
jgi:hypothetical protein